MDQSKELLRKQLELLAEQSESAAEDDLPELSSAMVEIYDRLAGTACEPYVIVCPQCGRDKNGTFRCVCGRCRRLHKGVST